jgi:hypothetical protein
VILYENVLFIPNVFYLKRHRLTNETECGRLEAKDSVSEFALRSACGPHEGMTQRLIKLPRELDDQFKKVALFGNVSVSALMRGVMADAISTGKALSLAEEIASFGNSQSKN